MSPFDPKSKPRSSVQIATAIGVLFGACFPAVSYSIRNEPQYLYWVICTAPVVLGYFSFLLARESKNATEIEANARNLAGQLKMQNELQLERAKSIRSAKLASLGEMAAGMAHEINNPLAVISATVDLLAEKETLSENAKTRIETIQKSCARIVRIVTGLKKFSRSDQKLHLKNHKLTKIVEESLILTESKSKRHDVTMSVNLQSSDEIFCDDIEIEQVLVNLINNAVDAVREREERWVRITVRSSENLVHLRIEDSGPGIPPEIRAKLFQPFFTTKKVGEGTGLGLSIAKGILDDHHATIQVCESSPNTCFEVQFPKVAVAKVAA